MNNLHLHVSNISMSSENKNVTKYLKVKLENLIRIVEIQKKTGDGEKKNKNILVAVSGGADSVGLLYQLVSIYKYSSDVNIKVVYINHSIQNRDTQQKEFDLVTYVCKKFDLPLYALSLYWKDFYFLNKYTHKTIKKNEASLRKARYDSLLEVASAIDVRYIVTAHHAQDVYEQVLMRTLGYAGWQGSSGIPEIRDIEYKDIMYYILRPALYLSPQSFHTAQLPHHEEESNKRSYVFMRNTVRNIITPQLIKVFPNAVDNVVSFAQKQTQVLKVIESSTPTWLIGSVFQEKKISMSTALLSVLHDTHRQKLIYNGANLLGISHISAAFVDECVQKMSLLYDKNKAWSAVWGNKNDDLCSREIQRYGTQVFFGNRYVVWTSVGKNVKNNDKIHRDIFLDLENMYKKYYCDSSALSDEARYCVQFSFAENCWTYDFVPCDEVCDATMPLEYRVFLELPVHISFPTKHCKCAIGDVQNKVAVRDVLSKDIGALWKNVPIICDLSGMRLVAGEALLGRTLINFDVKNSNTNVRRKNKKTIPFIIRIGYQTFGIQYEKL